MWKKELILAIKKDLSDIQQKNPRYSLRAYSKKIGVGFGSLSDLMNSKRHLSPALGKRILEKLALEKEQSERLDEQIEGDLNIQVTLVPEHAQIIVENWYYFAILNIVELDLAPDSVERISERLNLSTELVTESIDRLVAWGFLEKQNGTLIVRARSWKTSDDISSESIRKSHLDGLALAQKAMLELPVESRDLASFVFPGNSANLAKAKSEIRRCLHKVYKIMSTGELDSVYRINSQLFPIDRWNSVSKKTKAP